MDVRRSMRKKTHSNLSSPQVTRSTQAPVTMEGWLYKQDSKGLKQWKKRWFILSDYCLFYYKSRGDENNLGSILLPSYKINPCTSDDRISRKNSFKAEHHNMRTYYFAAENREEMSKWMNCMSLATILQKQSSVNQTNVKNHRTKSVPNSHDIRENNSQYRSQRYVADENSTLNSSMMSESSHRSRLPSNDPPYDPSFYSRSRLKDPPVEYNGNETLPSHRAEHLYVNAPPKPYRFSPYDESIMQEYHSSSSHHSPSSDAYRQKSTNEPSTEEQYMSQLRSKSGALFGDYVKEYNTQKTLPHRGIEGDFSYDSRVQKQNLSSFGNHIYDRDANGSPHRNISGARSFPIAPRRSGHYYQAQNSPSVIPEGKSGWVEQSDYGVRYSQAKHQTYNQTNDDDRLGDVINKNGRVPSMSRNDQLVLLRENQNRASTRSLGNAMTKLRPTSTGFQFGQFQGHPSKPLTRDDSFTVNMEKQNKYKAEQKEASMKRLLEWKQRMLHSPLTKNVRKPLDRQEVETPPPRPPLPEQVLKDLVNHENAALRTINSESDNQQFSYQSKLNTERKIPQQPIKPGPELLPENENRPSSRLRDRSRSSSRMKEDKNIGKIQRPPSRTQDRRSSSLNRFKDHFSSEDEDETPERNRRNVRRQGQRRLSTEKDDPSQNKSDGDKLRSEYNNNVPVSTHQRRDGGSKYTIAQTQDLTPTISHYQGGIVNPPSSSLYPNKTESGHGNYRGYCQYPDSKTWMNKQDPYPDVFDPPMIDHDDNANTTYDTKLNSVGLNRRTSINEVGLNTPDQTYVVSEEGPSKEELRYAQELLYRKYESKRQSMGRNERSLTSAASVNSNELGTIKGNQISVNIPNLGRNDRMEMYAVKDQVTKDRLNESTDSYDPYQHLYHGQEVDSLPTRSDDPIQNTSKWNASRSDQNFVFGNETRLVNFRSQSELPKFHKAKVENIQTTYPQLYDRLNVGDTFRYHDSGKHYDRSKLPQQIYQSYGINDSDFPKDVKMTTETSQNQLRAEDCDLQRFNFKSEDMLFSEQSNSVVYNVARSEIDSKDRDLDHVGQMPHGTDSSYKSANAVTLSSTVSPTCNPSNNKLSKDVRYENIDSIGNQNFGADEPFNMQYKSQFGRETAGIYGSVRSNYTPSREIGKQESDVKDGDESMIQLSDTMMYKLAHDSTLQSDKYVSKSALNHEINNNFKVLDTANRTDSFKKLDPSKTNCTVQGLRKSKEAPPTNIVQQRIKHFEISSQHDDQTREKSNAQPASSTSAEKTSPRRRFYSDSEAVLYGDTSSDSGASDNENNKAELSLPFGESSVRARNLDDRVFASHDQYVAMESVVTDVTTVLDESVYMPMSEHDDLRHLQKSYLSSEATGRYSDFAYNADDQRQMYCLETIRPNLKSLQSYELNDSAPNLSSNYQPCQNFDVKVSPPQHFQDSSRDSDGLIRRTRHVKENSDVSQASYKCPVDLKPPHHFRDSSQYSETDSRLSVQSIPKPIESPGDVSDLSQNFTEDKPEPFLLPVKTLSTQSALKSKSPVLNDGNLPDLLKHQEGEESVFSEQGNVESDASDADDEASKDFDAIPTKQVFHPEFQNWYDKDATPNDAAEDSDSGKDSIPSYPPPPPPMTSVPSSESNLRSYYEVHLNDENLGSVQEPVGGIADDRVGEKHSEAKPEENSDRLHPSSGSILDNPADYSSYRVYEDDRRVTQFLVRPAINQDNKPKLRVKKMRIYNEGKRAENMKRHPIDLTELNMEALNSSPLQDSSPVNQVAGDVSASASLQEDLDGGHYVGLRLPSTLLEAKSPNTVKSPNSAPYYYSDLLKDDGNLDGAERCYSPRSIMRPLPNNFRSISPPTTIHADIGRRVNLIHQQEAEHLNEELENNRRYPISNSEITPEIRCSLEQILGSKSNKFSDLERNKYEAGHTLEKTKHLESNKLKLRSATPDFDSTFASNQSSVNNRERSSDVLNHNLLSRRLSRSLEDLLDGSATASNGGYNNMRRPIVSKPPPPIPPPKPIRSSEPYYENSAHLKRMNKLEIVQGAHDSDLARKGLQASSVHDARPQPYPAKHSVSPDGFVTDATPVHRSQEAIYNSHGRADDDYLTRHSARLVNEHHFRNRYQRENHQNPSRPTSTSSRSFLEEGRPDPEPGPDIQTTKDNSSTNHFLGLGQKSDFKGGGSDANRGDVIISIPESQIDDAQTNNNLAPAPCVSSAQSSVSSHDEDSGRDFEPGIKTTLNEQKRQQKRPVGTVNDESNMSDSEIQIRSTSKLRRLVRQSEGLSNRGKRLSISAGELLGKTHEELVLLLIQLRRNQAKITKAREQCRKQVDNLKNNVNLDSNDILMLQQQFRELDNQSDASRPLINLVDNMVKLGSLYGGSDQMLASQYKLDGRNEYVPPKSMIEFSRKMQEKKLVQGSKEELNNMTPEEVDLEDKLHQLFRLDRELQEESSVLTGLQHDRDILEKTQEGIKKKIHDVINEIDKERLKKQQKLIEKELMRVKTSLANSVKRLEDKTTENSRVEHEILVLRQKIHQTLMKCGASKATSAGVDKLEGELSRVQSTLDELADRRKELCNAVNIIKLSSSLIDIRASPTGIAGSAALPGKKKPCTTYLETDMDTYISVDVGTGNSSSSPLTESTKVPPIYVNTEVYEDNGRVEDFNSQELSSYEPQDINDADEKMKRFYGILPREKPSEIKTVRIVKREAERRHKDKKKVTYDESSLVQVIEHTDLYDDEEDDQEYVDDSGSFQRSLTLPRNFASGFNQRNVEQPLSARERLFGGVNSLSLNSSPVKTKPPEVIKKVAIRRQKRRHHTVIGSSQTLPHSSNYMIPQSRSRDDLDMEHCLRTVNTPDVVKSTIKKNEVIDTNTIDRELGLPQKICIPERYIDVEPEPKLSVTEQLARTQKAASIRKMLSESAQYEDIISDPSNVPKTTMTLKKKVDEERRKREHLLALNQVLAKEVMQRSKYVAGRVTPCKDDDDV